MSLSPCRKQSPFCRNSSLLLCLLLIDLPVFNLFLFVVSFFYLSMVCSSTMITSLNLRRIQAKFLATAAPMGAESGWTSRSRSCVRRMMTFYVKRRTLCKEENPQWLEHKVIAQEVIMKRRDLIWDCFHKIMMPYDCENK